MKFRYWHDQVTNYARKLGVNWYNHSSNPVILNIRSKYIVTYLRYSKQMLVPFNFKHTIGDNDPLKQLRL